ncbi:reverse transcriptase [Penicillium waksmanii]|uniref:reverse transcriptase n=1 Tax=Penicillium waksmanii TaxID=69791 RepID=UPI0025477976|nr:reverse transcriptase [Penicillium waksmanii]KAJ5980181.1 reverse transcriptase [Penicillium waksmanii]
MNTVQRTVLIRILSSFRTVATTILEVEAHILPTHLSLRYRAQRTIARLYTLPRDNPIWDALSRARNRKNNVGSYARFPIAEALKTMDVDRLNALEMIDPRPLLPWRSDAFTEIELDHDRETARERAEIVRNISNIAIYSDASGREGYLGAAIVALNDDDEVMESQQIQVGPMDSWSVNVAELIGIFYAVKVVFKLAEVWIALSTHPFPLFFELTIRRSFHNLFIQFDQRFSAISYFKINGSCRSMLTKKCGGDEEKPHGVCKPADYVDETTYRNFGVPRALKKEALTPQR